MLNETIIVTTQASLGQRRQS